MTSHSHDIARYEDIKIMCNEFLELFVKHINFRYCTNGVKCMLVKSFCANMYCCPLWFNSTSSSIKS